MKIILYTLYIMLILFSCSPKQDVPVLAEQEGFIQVTGGKVWYRIVGADKKGIPLLTIHGGPGAPHDYFEPLEALATDRPVIFYDQLGCGNSDMPSDTALWNVTRFVEELQQICTTLQLNEVHVLGGSWGTMLAAEYMLKKKPAGVVSLIFSGPFFSTPKWEADQQMWISKLPGNIRDTIRKYEQNGDFSSPSYQSAMMEFYRLHVCRLDPWPDCLNRAFGKMGAEVYNYMWGPSEFTTTGALRNADITEQLGLIRVPVLFTCGEFDEATPATTLFYQSKITGSEIYVFDDASHLHFLEKPDEYLQTVKTFLDKAELKK